METPPSGYAPYQRPEMPLMPSSEEKSQALICWVLSIFIGFLSPLIFYIVGKEKPFVYETAKHCLTFHLVALVMYVISSILIVVLVGIFLYIAVAIAALVICIMGAIASNNGQLYVPPVTGGWTSKIFKN